MSGLADPRRGRVHRLSGAIRASSVVAIFLLMLCFPLFVYANPQSDRTPVNPALKADPAAGKPIFERYCSPCHGVSGTGGHGPRLNRSYLQHAPDEKELRSIIANGLPPAMPGASYLGEEEIANIASHVRSLSEVPEEIITGDADRGAAIYARSDCSSCHIHNGRGIGYGPELTTVGDRRSTASLRYAVENPASELPEGFLLVTAVTLTGKSVTGIRMHEDTFTIQIKDIVGKLYSSAKNISDSSRVKTGKLQCHLTASLPLT